MNKFYTLFGRMLPVVSLSALALAGCRKAPVETVRVATYNIRYPAKDGENSWEKRRADLVTLVQKMDLDVFGLQEVAPEQAAYLRAQLPEFAFVGEHREADRVSGEASPVCYRKSRFDALKAGTFWLSETPDVPGRKGWGAACPRVCSYLILRDKLSGRTFCFANTHTDHISALAREKGMSLVIERMKDFGAGAPLVFVGDHNCRETEAPALAVAKLLKNALSESETPPVGSWRTWNDWRWRDSEVPTASALRLSAEVRNQLDGSFYEECGGPRIDYIYVSPGVRVLDYATVNDSRPGLKRYPSDHFPIVATLALP